MTPKWSARSSNSYRELSLHENGECKSTLTKSVPSPTSCFGLHTANPMSLSSQKKDGNVYKRRKMDKDSNPIAIAEAKEMAAQSCTISDDHSSLLLPIEPNSESITEHVSPRDLCIAILIKDGLINASRTRMIHKEEFTDDDANLLLACNNCSRLEHSLKMLICDSCEAAFHLSCCIPCIEELPTDEWYCAPCLCKKPKSLYGKLSEGKIKPSRNTNTRPHGMSHIEYMLKDAEPYVTGVRIGRDFQAEVPEWSGPSSSSDGYFDEPCEFGSTELTTFNLCKIGNESHSSIGNWIQCRETLNPGDSEKPVICGKWRRAPLYVVQSDDWDCFCCLLWDPARADCAVPQELKTSEVLKQLKLFNMLKNQPVDKNQKPA